MDNKEALNLVQEHGYNLERLENEFKKDKEIVLLAVTQDGYSMEYADKSLKKDPDILKILESSEY